MPHGMEDEIHLRWRAVGKHRIGLRAAEHEHAVAGADGCSHRVAIARNDLGRIVCQRERNGDLASFSIDKSFCNGLRRNVCHRRVKDEHIDDGVSRKRDALTIGNRAGELSVGRLRR